MRPEPCLERKGSVHRREGKVCAENPGGVFCAISIKKFFNMKNLPRKILSCGDAYGKPHMRPEPCPERTDKTTGKGRDHAGTGTAAPAAAHCGLGAGRGLPGRRGHGPCLSPQLAAAPGNYPPGSGQRSAPRPLGAGQGHRKALRHGQHRIPPVQRPFRHPPHGGGHHRYCRDGGRDDPLHFERRSLDGRRAAYASAAAPDPRRTGAAVSGGKRLCHHPGGAGPGPGHPVHRDGSQRRGHGAVPQSDLGRRAADP